MLINIKIISKLYMFPYGSYLLSLVVAFVSLACADNDDSSSSSYLKIQVPPEVTNIAGNYLADSNKVWGFYDAKKNFKLDFSLYAEDIKVGKPLPEKFISADKLELSNDSTPIDSLFMSNVYWYLPVLAKNKVIYVVGITNNTRSWHISHMKQNLGTELQKVQSAWPEETKSGALVMVRWANKSFIHFPKKGKMNLTEFGHTVDSNGFYVPKDSYRNLDSLNEHRKRLKTEYLKYKTSKERTEKGRE